MLLKADAGAARGSAGLRGRLRVAAELPAARAPLCAQPELWAGAARNRGCAEMFLLELHSFVASLSPDLLVLILLLLIASKKLESLGVHVLLP